MRPHWRARPEYPLPTTPEERLEAAEKAGEEGEAVRERVQGQVSFLKELRARWGRVYEENHLAELFRDDWRSTH
jgi:hypothetical protein